MAEKEKESVKNAVRNPSLHTRKALADLLNQQQTDGIAEQIQQCVDICKLNEI